MLKFLGGVFAGVALGAFLASSPAVTERLSEIGRMLSWSALVTLL